MRVTFLLLSVLLALAFSFVFFSYVWRPTELAPTTSVEPDRIESARKVESKAVLVEVEEKELPSDTIITADGTLACLLPSSLREAQQAVAANDPKWLESLGCLQVREGIPTIIVRTGFGPLDPWQVRLRPPGREGATRWVQRFNLRTVGGLELDEFGHPKPKPIGDARAPIDLVKATPKGDLQNPYNDQIGAIAEDGHKKIFVLRLQRLPWRRGRRGYVSSSD